MSAVIVSAAAPYVIGAIGTGVALYGANKQNMANKAAAAANTANNNEDQSIKWAQYLMARGINPTTGGAINTKMPLWANVTAGNNGAGAITGLAPASYTKANTPTLASLGWTGNTTSMTS